MSGQNDCKFNYMLTVCLGSFLCIALHICIISNVIMVHVSLSMVPFFSPSKLTREVDCHSQNKLGDLQQTIFLFLQLGNYFLSVKQL